MLEKINIKGAYDVRDFIADDYIGVDTESKWNRKSTQKVCGQNLSNSLFIL